MILSPPADISVRPPLLLHALKYKCSRSHHHHRHHHHHHHRHHHQHHRNHCHHHTNQQIYICTYIYTHIRCVLVGCSLFVCFNWIFSVFEQDPCYLCVSSNMDVDWARSLVFMCFKHYGSAGLSIEQLLLGSRPLHCVVDKGEEFLRRANVYFAFAPHNGRLVGHIMEGRAGQLLPLLA